jgi:hypothetical protein
MAQPQDADLTDPAAADRLVANRATGWAEVAMANIGREFPHIGLHGWRDELDLPKRPREQHAVFYGSLDWHSCVEMHWLLVRLLRQVPDDLPSERVRGLLDEQLTEERIAQEAEALPPWERPYGWAWTLMLADDLAGWDDPDSRRWSTAMRPLISRIVAGFLEWFEVATYPVRGGLHANSAFALSLSLRYARRHSPELAWAIEQVATRWFAADTDYPAHYEPSGTDFLSPCLTEAELMASLLPAGERAGWLSSYLPGLADGEPQTLFAPAVVSDPSDGQIAHLHGLNLSRAWGFHRLADTLPVHDPRVPVLREAMARHAAASLDQTTGSDYMVEHWLAAYAVLLLTPEQ